MNKRIEDIIAETRLNEILHKNEAEKQKNTVIWTLAIIGAVAAVAAIAYAVQSDVKICERDPEGTA